MKKHIYSNLAASGVAFDFTRNKLLPPGLESSSQY